MVVLTLDQRLTAILVYLATSQRDADAIRLVLETQTDPSESVSRILYEGRKHLAPAMMPVDRSGAKNLRLPPRTP